MSRKNGNPGKVAVAALVFAALTCPAISHAGGSTASFGVSITVVDNCRVSAPSSQSSGQDAVRQPATGGSGNIAVNCSRNTPAMVTFGNGAYRTAMSGAAASGTQVATLHGTNGAHQSVPAYPDTIVATVTF